MVIVYIVLETVSHEDESGSEYYEDKICGVFSTEQKAQAYIFQLAVRPGSYFIQEWTLDLCLLSH